MNDQRECRRTIPLRYVAAILFTIEALLIVAYWLSLSRVDHGFFVKSARFWDLDGESNLPEWFSTIQLWMVATVFGLTAWKEFNPRKLAPWSLVLAAAAFAFLSCDEGAMVHERIATLFDHTVKDRSQSTYFGRTGVWVIILGPLLLALAVANLCAMWTYLRGRKLVTVLGIVGFSMFIGGAVGVETYSNRLTEGTDIYFHTVMLEELLEMGGVTLMLCGALRLAGDLGVAKALIGEKPASTTATTAPTQQQRSTSANGLTAMSLSMPKTNH
jgi:hypothetical protein